MGLRLQIEKITGLPSERRACGVFVGRVTLGDSADGTIVTCILIEDGKTEDLTTYQNDLFEIVSKKLEGVGSGILEVLRLCLANCQDYIAGKGIEVSFAILVFAKGACYIGRSGRAIAILVFKQGAFSEIKFEFGSGPTIPGQIYLVATDSLLSFFDTSVLRHDKEINLGEIIDGLATEISTREDQSEIGAAFVYVREEQEKKEIEDIEDSQGIEEVTGDEAGKKSEEAIVAVSAPQEEVKRGSGVFLFGRRLIGGFWKELVRLRRGEVRAVLRLRKNLIVASIIILLVLAGSAVLTVRATRERSRVAEFNSHYSAASAKYSEALAIIELNKTRARNILIEADQEIKLALDLDRDNFEAKALGGEIAAKLKETESIAGVNFRVVAESEDSVISLTYDGNNLWAITMDKILKINLVNKEVVDIKGVGLAQAGFVWDQAAFVLVNDKVFKIDLTREESKQLIEWEQASDIWVFLGNIYLLTEDEIAKFVPVEAGYSGPVDYLNEKVQFGREARMAIDGSIWITAGDKIFKFTRGEKQPFEIAGLVGGQAGLRFGSIYTNADLDNLYVVDQSNLALLVIDKEGIYQKAYQGQEFAKASDLVVDEAQDKMYLAVDNKILEADLE